MTWREVDPNSELWTVPASRMKASEEHQKPLNDAAIRVLQAVNEEGLAPTDFVFSAPRGGSLSDMTLSAVLKRMDRKITVHGMRSAFRDWTGIQPSFRVTSWKWPWRTRSDQQLNGLTAEDALLRSGAN